MVPIEQNVSLRMYNTFGIDVRAAHFAVVNNLQEIESLLNEGVYASGVPLVLGGGSNVLFTKDVERPVLLNRLKGIELVGEDEQSFLVKAASGENWHQFVMHCIKQEYAGLENLSLIPGSVGASPMQNIGAYGVEIKDVFHSLEAFHIHEKKVKVFDSTECSFGYRESVFKRKEKDQWIILSVTFRLMKRPVFRTDYGAIQQELDKMKLEKMTIKAISQAVINIRSSKLPDPKQLGNAGSFFKNPVVAMEQVERIKKDYPQVPFYPIDEYTAKIPAGWLIETAGWKGKRMGNYGVHALQALVLVNYGGASGTEIYELSSAIVEDISDRFGVTLEREVNIF